VIRHAPALLSLSLVAAACNNNVHSAEDAQRAYLGLDASIDKAITLGFAGFNSASSANISPQTASGTSSGKVTVTGMVDQGASANKGMRLNVSFQGYSDDGKITYDANPAALPTLDMQLKNIPNGTLTGSLAGTITMTGEETGDLTLALSFTGELQPDPTDMTKVQRKPGTTHITGTATSSAGTYTVDVTK
jgi:hypothetical protein